MVRFSNARSVSPSRARRAESRRLEILRAAARTFRRKGFAGAGMRDIAAEAGLSPANLYHYFRSKDEILFFCQDRWLEQMLATLHRVQRDPRPLPDRLRTVLRAHVQLLLDELEGSAAHLEVEVLPPHLRRRIVAKRDRYERALRRLVARGARQGVFAPCDPALVTRGMLGALNWTARWFRTDGALRAEDVADLLVEFLLRGLGSPAAAGAGRPARLTHER